MAMQSSVSSLPVAERPWMVTVSESDNLLEILTARAPPWGPSSEHVAV
jgi:hypothetical protein